MRTILSVVIASALATSPSPAIAGQAIERKNGAVISGRVIDGFGDPVMGVRVAALAQAASVTNVTPVATSDTDDRGEYRLAHLPEGAFLVAMTTMTPVQQNGGSGVTATARQLFYPGVATPAEAQAVRLQPGEERPGLDFTVPAGEAAGLAIATLKTQMSRRPAQNPRLPAQTPPPRPTGVVRGRVADVDGRAIPHAQVLVFAATRTDSRSAITDEDGRFEVGELGAGSVRVSANKPGYTQLESGRAVTPASLDLGVVRAGTLSNFAWGRAIDLAAGELRDRVELTLARWGTLSGRVSDEHGEPVQGAGVQLLRVRYEAGRRRLVAADAMTGTTDDLGRYRLHSLAPGRYVVSAAVGHVSSQDLPGYTRTYYPGTPAPGEAQFVAVALSQDVAAIDVALSRARTASVSGQAFNPAGEPSAPGALTLVPSRHSPAVTSVAVGARIAPDGTFSFPNVPPGEYVIQAYRGRSNPHTEGEFGAVPVDVNGIDVTGLRLQTSSGSSIAGRITFESFDRTPPAKTSDVELAPIPVDVDLSPSNGLASAEIHADWTFEIAGVSGPRRLQMLRAPAGWALKQIRADGIDVTDMPLPLGRQDQSLAHVEVVMNDRLSGLSGTVADDRARPAPGSNLIVFSTSRDRWYPASRFLRQTSAGSDGAFTVAGIPPDTYYVAAVERIPNDGDEAWQDPQFLESLVPRASTVTVIDGQKTQLAVRLSPP